MALILTISFLFLMNFQLICKFLIFTALMVLITFLIVCYRPIHITNPVKQFELYHPVSLDVPCGTCCDCVKAKRNEWFIRSYYQFLETTEKYHGSVFYVTLTFAPKFLPRYVFQETDLQETTFTRDELDRLYSTPCFSRRYVQLFMKRFRKALDTHFGKTDVRYFITSEYGGQTHRPHHHGLLFINRPLSFVDRCYIKSIMSSVWSYGYVHFGKKTEGIKEVGIVQNVNCLLYVSKYVSKDISFNYKLPRRVRPFHLQSKGYGIYMIERLKMYDDLDVLVQNKLFFSDTYSYNIPMYIQRKITHDYIYERSEDGTVSVRYKLNDTGKFVRISRTLNSLQSLSDNLIMTFNYALNNFLGSNDLNFSLDFGSLPALLDEVRPRWHQFVFFCSFLHDRVINFNCFPTVFSLPETEDDFVDLLHEYYFHDGTEVTFLDGHTYDFDEIDLHDFDSSLLEEFLRNSANNVSPPEFFTLFGLYNRILGYVGSICQKQFDDDAQAYANSKLLSNEVI